MRFQFVTTIFSVVFLLLGGAMVVLGSWWAASSLRQPEDFIAMPAGLGLIGLGVLLLLAAFLGLRRLSR